MNRSTARGLRWYWALGCALAGGGGLFAATPWLGWWPAGLLGATLCIIAVWQQSWWLGALVGAVAGAAYWLPEISWLTLYLGPVPWLALCSVMIFWFALWGGLAGPTTRGLARLVPARAWRIAAQVVALSGLWVLREQVQGSWPYGGFAWGRLAHTQSDGPLLQLVSWLGIPGVSAVLAALSAIPVAVFFAVGSVRRRIAAVASVLVAVLLLMLVPSPQLPQTGTLRVAAIQGNSKSGIFDDRENGDVFRAHAVATESLLDRLERDGREIDVIVWPENSAEFDLPGQFYREHEVQRLAARAQAPVVVGTVLRDPNGEYTNSTLIYDAHGETGVRYDKRRPVPFAEYMPNREFFRALAPDLVDLVQLEYEHGTRPAVLPLQLDTGTVAAGIAICFDIIFDDHMEALFDPKRAGALGPAKVILAQTNNADFGRTAESAQQLAIARMRAVESGRALINISTVGTSAVVLPHGAIADQLPTHTPGALVAEVPLVDGETPALRSGGLMAVLWMLLGGIGGAVGVFGSVRAARPRD